MPSSLPDCEVCERPINNRRKREIVNLIVHDEKGDKIGVEDHKNALPDIVYESTELAMGLFRDETVFLYVPKSDHWTVCVESITGIKPGLVEIRTERGTVKVSTKGRT
jgi:hypothetical protein